jgi:proline iminopeptidase
MPTPPAPGNPPAHEDRLSLGGATLYCRELGRGTPLVVLHGGPDFDHQYLLPGLDRLVESCRLVYYAQRGRGASRGNVRPEDVSLASEIADLDALREHLGLDTVALLGHSWGGVLAMEYAIRHPEHTSRLVLMNAGPASHGDYLFWRAERQRTARRDMDRLAELVLTATYISGDVAADLAYYRLHFASTVTSQEQLEGILRSLRANFTPEGILCARAIEARLMEETWRSTGYDLIPRLRELRVPTLMIHGEHDLIPEACARRVAEAIPGARLEVLAGSGHFSYLDAPEALQAAVSGFLA